MALQSQRPIALLEPSRAEARRGHADRIYIVVVVAGPMSWPSSR